eukprot:151690_1
MDNKKNQSIRILCSKSLKKHNLKIDNNNKCFGNDGTDDCDALHRLTQALQYHSVMNQEEFTDFCVNNYKNALNDHIHFMMTHSKQDEQINNIFIQRDDFSRCAVSKCNAFGRHYTKRRQKTTNDETYSFYMDLFDQFHHFIYHLFDIGLRILPNEIDNIENK